MEIFTSTETIVSSGLRSVQFRSTRLISKYLQGGIVLVKVPWQYHTIPNMIEYSMPARPN